MSSILTDRLSDQILNTRQKDGIDYAQDPSRFNPVVTVRHARQMITAYSVSLGVIHSGVTNIIAMRALDVSNDNRTDRMLVLVEDDPNLDYNGLYRYDEQAVSGESLPYVVEPDDTVGRWIQVSKSTALHNALGLLQGGKIAERYHLDKDQNDAALGSFGTPSISNPFVTTSDPRVGSLIQLEAEEVIPAFSPVYISGSLKMRRADPSVLSKMPAIGLIGQTTTIGTFYPILSQGFLMNGVWSFTPNKEIFVGVGGILTEIVPITGYYLSIGRSISTNIIQIRIGNLVRL